MHKSWSRSAFIVKERAMKIGRVTAFLARNTHHIDGVTPDVICLGGRHCLTVMWFLIVRQARSASQMPSRHGASDLFSLPVPPFFSMSITSNGGLKVGITISC